MMSTLAPLLGVFGFLAFAIGLILRLPIRALKAGRPIATKLSVGGVVVFIIALILTPEPELQSAAKFTAQSDAPRVEAVTRDTRSEEAKQKLVDQYRKVLRAAKPCDEALAALSDAVERTKTSGDVIQLMSATAGGQNSCAAAAAAIRPMTAPVGLPVKAAEQVTNALASCFRGYDRREQAFKRATNIISGEGGEINEAVQDIERSQADLTHCIVGYVAAASEAGIDPKRMM